MSLIITREPFIVTAAFNRPESMNAINFDAMEKLEELLGEIEIDATLRLFILTGIGNSFVSGGDLKEFHKIKDAEGAKVMTRRMIQILSRIENLPIWTLAALNGHTYGGGWEIALAFDFRVASSSAKIGFTQGKFYLPPGWGGISKLTDTVGQDRARYWLASQKVISAYEALEAGFIQDCFDEQVFREKVEKLKQQLTLNDRAFISYLKNHAPHSNNNNMNAFSRFWESEEHLKRVDEFLKGK